MKVAIIGSRAFSYNKYDWFKTQLENILLHYNLTDEPLVIISGGAIGIDTLAERYADENHIEKKIYKILNSDKIEYGYKRAPLIRNDRIIADSDFIIAFWDGNSHGTKYVIDKCNKLKKCHTIIKI